MVKESEISDYIKAKKLIRSYVFKCSIFGFSIVVAINIILSGPVIMDGLCCFHTLLMEQSISDLLVNSVSAKQY